MDEKVLKMLVKIVELKLKPIPPFSKNCTETLIIEELLESFNINDENGLIIDNLLFKIENNQVARDKINHIFSTIISTYYKYQDLENIPDIPVLFPKYKDGLNNVL